MDPKPGSDFTCADFLLVMQTEQQSVILACNPRTVCVDATHGVTGYGYCLMTMLVIDKQGTGFPVAWAISSRENGWVWRLFGASLREESLSSKPEVLMSDDTNAAWNGLCCVWKSLKHKLLCHWHIKKNVRLHCVGSKSKVQVPAVD